MSIFSLAPCRLVLSNLPNLDLDSSDGKLLRLCETNAKRVRTPTHIDANANRWSDSPTPRAVTVQNCKIVVSRRFLVLAQIAIHT